MEGRKGSKEWSKASWRRKSRGRGNRSKGEGKGRRINNTQKKEGGSG